MRVFQLKREAVVIERAMHDKTEALERLIRLVCDAYNLDCFDTIHRLIVERESKLSTGIGLEVAVPHCRIDTAREIVAGVMLIPHGIDYNSVDGLPVKLIFLLVSPTEDIRGHLACLSSISQAVSDEETRLRLILSKNTEAFYDAILESVTTG
jgi:mannitol/fructose-specific phosphotransferase system IIA component (Ntr-type)